MSSGSDGEVSARESEPGSRWQRWWPRLRLVLTLLFFGAVAFLLVVNARQVDWGEVARVVRGYSAGTLATAAGLAAAGHLFYTSYDLLARRHTGHGLPWPRVLGVAFVSYAFNLNLGPLIGAVALRFRLYSAFQLTNSCIARVLGFSIVANWLGYIMLGGALFAARVVELPPDWDIGMTALRIIGIGMILVVLGYLWLCAGATRRSLRVRRFRIELPSLPMALLQLAASCASWTTIAAILYVLLQQQIALTTVLGVLLVAALAGVLTHIPAGLGVIEATFVLLLGHRLPASELLAAVLAYRAVYYLGPLMVALVIYPLLEFKARRLRSAT